MPSDYYAMSNYCADISGETVEKIANAEPGLLQLKKGIDDNRKRTEYSFLIKIKDRIRTERFVSFNSNLKRQTSNHALVEVTYGKDNFHYNKDNFLLVKEDGSWKLFMITNTWFLSEDNNFFAESTCNVASNKL